MWIIDRHAGIAAVLLGALLLLSGAAVQAADANKRYALKGIGLASCATYAETGNKNPKTNKEKSRNLLRRAAFHGWLYGYLSAVNRFEKRTYDVVSWQSRRVLHGMLTAYCRKNPKQRFFMAVNILTEVLKRDRVRTRSPIIAVESGQGKTRIYREVVRRVQKALARLGYYAGSIDGRFGPNTRLGIEAYQQKENIKVTGIPDQRTLVRLLRPPPRSGAAPAR